LSIVTGAAWSIGFVIAALGLWRLKAWGRHWLLIAIVAYQLQVWIGRLTLERSSYEALTRPAAVAVSIGSIAIVWFSLYLPKIRRAFDTQHAPRNTEPS
jgi:type VI protein secretion system component VasK